MPQPIRIRGGRRPPPAVGGVGCGGRLGPMLGGASGTTGCAAGPATFHRPPDELRITRRPPVPDGRASRAATHGSDTDVREVGHGGIGPPPFRKTRTVSAVTPAPSRIEAWRVSSITNWGA